MNKRQVKLLDPSLEGFEGKLASSKAASVAKCSPDTALRGINELMSQGVLRKFAAGERSTIHELNEPPRCFDSSVENNRCRRIGTRRAMSGKGRFQSPCHSSKIQCNYLW